MVFFTIDANNDSQLSNLDILIFYLKIFKNWVWHFQIFFLHNLYLNRVDSNIIFVQTHDNSVKKNSNLCRKLWFSNPYIFAIQFRISQILQTINSVRSNKICNIYQRFTPSGCKDIEILSGKDFLYGRTDLINRSCQVFKYILKFV